MRGSVTLAALVAGTLLLATACREAPPPPLVADAAGTYAVPGLSASVRVVRDRWGVPHIYARTTDDLFAAQGFVQAQDRLFQMDLWRRSVQGRLAEVLGPNFVERDAMTRRMQYRGDLDADWASYGADVKAIAAAFVRGINAWVALARDRPPEAFVLAGWKPDFWSPPDLLNRTEAFVAAGDAIDEVRRARMSDVIADAIRGVGAPPFFAGGAAVDQGLVALTSIGHARATHAGVLSIAEAGRRLEHPSRRYVVHLNAPGWNVIGATAPWRPGVAIGHNDRIAWGMSAIDADTQDVFKDDADRVTGAFKEYIAIKGRAEPFTFDRTYTNHGVVVAADVQHQAVFTVRWNGTEPGTAPELASLAIDRARTWPEFREAVARWKTPSTRFAYADADGNIGFQDAALIPIRRGGEWDGWRAIDDLPHALNPSGDEMAATDARRDPRPAAGGQALFAHPLAVTAARRQRFNIGPLNRPADDSPFRAQLTATDWDRSRAMNAPGQSESPASAHFSDLATLWAAGESFPLPFSDGAVQANTSATLTLVNARDGARPR